MLLICAVNRIYKSQLGAMVAALAPEVAPQKPQNMPHLNSPIDDCGNTLLHLACCHLDHSLVCILLLKGAQPNVVNFSGTTPLRIVRLLANEELERLLIEHGAKEDDLMDPRQLKQQQQQQQQQNDEKPATPTGGGNNNISSPQTTMQRQAAGQGNRLPNRRPQLRIADDISVQLQRQYAQRKLSMNESQLLLEAAYIGYEDIFSTLGQRLQSTDEDIDCQDAYGCTPLMRAGYRGQVSIVRTLLENRADPRKVDELGYSALIWTCLGGSFECLEFLLAVLASLTETLPETLNAVQGGTRQHAPQLTALIAAAYSGSKQCVNTLIRLGAAVNQRTESGLNALTVATWMGWKDIVPLLLSCGAELPSPNHHWIFLGLSRALGLTGDIQMDLQSIVSYIPPMPSDAEPFVNAEGMLLQLKLPIDTAINVQGQTLEHKSQIIKLRELIKNVWGAQIISKEAIINQYDPELQRKQRRKIIAEFGIKVGFDSVHS
jgi:ankyrin repeat protein